MNVSLVSDLNELGAKSKPFNLTIDELWDEINTSYEPEPIGDGCPPNLHECFSGKCIPYIDYDFLQDYEEDITLHLKKIKTEINKVFKDGEVIYADRSGFSVKHGKWKISLRAYIRGCGYFSCPPACGRFMKENIKIDIDNEAYKSRQNMGLVYSTKMGDDRILKILSDNDERIEWKSINKELINKTIIQNIAGETICLDTDDIIPEITSTIETGDGDYIDKILNSAKSHMPNLEIRKVITRSIGSKEHKIIEFIKSNDICALCKRIHNSNRAYALFLNNAAYLKCHDDDAQGKNILLFKETSSDIEIVLLQSDHQDEDYAEYFVKKYPNQFIVFDNTLYMFKNHNWSYCIDDSILYDFLGNHVYKELRNVLDTTYNDISDADIHAQIAKKMLKLRSWKTRSGIVSSIKAKIQIRNDIFDLKPNLIGFNNGIFDLYTGKLRAGKYDDYVSKTVGYDYIEIDDIKVKKLMEFIDKIMPMPDERDFLMRALSTGLYGKTLQNFFILSGEGGNGKDTLVSKLYRDAIGRDHFEYSNTTILTDKRKGDLCQGISNMHKKRAVVWSEIPKNSLLQGSIIKELTGVDQVNARGLYSKNTATLIHGTMFSLCNDIPRVDSVDGGLARRLFVIEFRSLFKNKEDIEKMTNTDNIFEANAYYDSQEFRDEYKMTLFHILTRYFEEFKNDGYLIKRVPESIKKASKRYLEESDDFLNWFNDVFERDENEYIQIKYIWDMFKNSDLYMNLNRSEKRVLNRAKLLENIKRNPNLKPYFSERYRPYIDGKQKEIRNVIVGYRLKTEEHSDSDDE